jgi:Zn-dependent protease
MATEQEEEGDPRPGGDGSFRLFRVAGVDVNLHWTWFLAGLLFMFFGTNRYEAAVWNVAEFVALFVIVLLHEFGHVLACRLVGGSAEQVVLWPLGGIPSVQPPLRPGPVLASVAGGPLVNLLLVPLTVSLVFLGPALDWQAAAPDLRKFVDYLWVMNLVLLGFNLLPIYPLDGGQILHALLWFGLGRWGSLQVVSVVGMAFGGLVVFVAMLPLPLPAPEWRLLIAILAGFVLLRSLAAFFQARELLRVLSLPRHDRLSCPSCRTSPPAGPFWVCDHCGTRFDIFLKRGVCPACGAWYRTTPCPYCGQTHAVDDWLGTPAPPAPPPPDEPPAEVSAGPPAGHTPPESR